MGLQREWEATLLDVLSHSNAVGLYPESNKDTLIELLLVWGTMRGGYEYSDHNETRPVRTLLLSRGWSWELQGRPDQTETNFLLVQAERVSQGGGHFSGSSRGWGHTHWAMSPSRLICPQSILRTTRCVFRQLLPSWRGMRREYTFLTVLFAFVVSGFIWRSWWHPGGRAPKHLNKNPELLR